MVAIGQTQSVDSFGRTAVETLDRIDRTGAAEVLTVDGQPRAILLSPAAYDALAREAELSQDAEVIRRSMAQYRAGLGRPYHEFSAELRAKVAATASIGPGPIE